MNTTASYSEQSWFTTPGHSRRGSIESELSIQGKETDYVRDTSDTDCPSDKLEYEPVTEPEDDGPLDWDSSGQSDNEIISTKVLEVQVGDDGDLEFADSEQSTGDSDSELDLHDFWRCARCRTENNNPLYRYCEKCFKVRKNFFPPRPRKNKRKRVIDVPRTNSVDSGVESYHSQESLSQPSQVIDLTPLTDLSQPGLSQTELSQPGLSQTELSQPGLSQTELSQSGLRHTDSQSGLIQTDLSQPGASQTNLSQIGLSQVELSQPDSQTDLSQPGVSQRDSQPGSQSDFIQTDLSQTGQSQDLSQPDPSQTGLSQSDLNQPGSSQSGLSQTEPTQSSLVRPLKRRAGSADRNNMRIRINYSDTDSDSDSDIEIKRYRKSKSADPYVAPLVKTTSDPSLTIDDTVKLTKKAIINSIKDKLDNENLCIICYSQPKSAVFAHSRIAHMCCCYECAKKVWRKAKRCPQCNCKVSNVMRVVL